MTGSVPYYGGRFSPAQAYAAAHPSSSPPAHPPVAPRPPAPPPANQVQALQHLLETGVLTQEEFEELRTRVQQ